MTCTLLLSGASANRARRREVATGRTLIKTSCVFSRGKPGWLRTGEESAMKLNPAHVRLEFHFLFYSSNGFILLFAQNRIEVSGGELRFSKLVLEDSGMYQCVAENKHGTVYASAELTVQGNFSFPSALGFNGTLKHFRSLPNILYLQSQSKIRADKNCFTHH